MVSIKTIKRLFTLSLAITIENLAHILRNNGKILLIGLYFGPQIIAYVSTCKTLFYFFPIRILDTLNHITYYEHAKFFSKGKFSEIIKFHKKHILLVMPLLIVFILFSLGIGRSVYSFWLNNKFDLTYIFLLVLVLDASCNIFKETVINVLKSLNIFLKISIIEFCFIFFATIVSYYLLSLGYSFMVYFFILLVQSFTVLIVSIFTVFKFSLNEANSVVLGYRTLLKKN